jgi:hypothetical protein
MSVSFRETTLVSLAACAGLAVGFACADGRRGHARPPVPDSVTVVVPAPGSHRADVTDIAVHRWADSSGASGGAVEPGGGAWVVRLNYDFGATTLVGRPVTAAGPR